MHSCTVLYRISNVLMETQITPMWKTHALFYKNIVNVRAAPWLFSNSFFCVRTSCRTSRDWHFELINNSDIYNSELSELSRLLSVIINLISIAFINWRMHANQSQHSHLFATWKPLNWQIFNISRAFWFPDRFLKKEKKKTVQFAFSGKHTNCSSFDCMFYMLKVIK